MIAIKVKENFPETAVVAYVAINADVENEFRYRPDENRVDIYAQDEAAVQLILNDLESRRFKIDAIVRT